MPRLVVKEGGRSWVLDLEGQDRVVVGRGRKSAIVLGDAAASREHCALEREGDGYWLVDLESRNGTRLNGKKLKRRTLLRTGDRIEIGAARIAFEAAGAVVAAADADALARDPDTGLRTFAFARATLERLLGEGGEPVALVKLSVDALGLLNEVYGRETGDLVVAGVARAVQPAVEESAPGATLARESGGRLVIVLPAGDEARAVALAELARERVAKAARDGELAVPSVTLSAGVAVAPARGSARELLRAADVALDEAKHRGHDRVATPPDEPGAVRLDAASIDATGAFAPLVESEPLALDASGQRALALASRALASDLDVDGLVEFALGVVARETGASRGLIVLKDDRGELRLGAAVSPGAPGQAQAAASHSLVRAALEKEDGILVADALEDQELGQHSSVVASGARSVVGAPIRAGDRTVGAIYLEDVEKPGRFAKPDLDLVRAFGRLLGGPIRRGLLHRRTLDELARAQLALRGTRDEDARLHARYRGIVGRSEPLQKLLRTLERIADRAQAVLIQGESGTGKELVARALHARSKRASGPFVAENCAALPDELLEAELFGWRKGAFTGADRDRTGLLEAADKGTLFLDEVGDMSPRLQAKLLRFLEDGVIRRLGDEATVKVSVRVVAATNRDLEAMIARGEFREDLFYRLAVLRVQLPPLRDRREDVPLLVEHLAAKAARELGRRPPGFAPETFQVLAAHDWPGNVRQLENEVRKLVALGLDPVLPEHVSSEVLGKRGAEQAVQAAREALLEGAASVVLKTIEQGKSMEKALDEVERVVLARTLEATDGNRSETARRLGLSRPGLRKKMKRLGIE